MRAVPEWVGATPDSMPPPRVRLRIFQRDNGICHLSGIKIGPADKWDLDHKTALCNGGLNVESNMAPALRSKHREKTAIDVADKAKNDRVSKRHLGIKSAKPKIQSAGFQKSRPQRTASRPIDRWMP